MSDDRMHHITVRINKDSYIGRKVLEALEYMKRFQGMSYNACFQESILLAYEGIQRPSTMVPVPEESFKKPGQTQTKKQTALNPQEKTEKFPDVERNAVADSAEEEISDEEMFALVGDTFSQDYS